jgi:hypothetical protein
MPPVANSGPQVATAGASPMIGNRGIAIAEDSTIIETARRRSFIWISEKIPLNRGDDLRVDDPRCAGKGSVTLAVQVRQHLLLVHAAFRHSL